MYANLTVVIIITDEMVFKIYLSVITNIIFN